MQLKDAKVGQTVIVTLGRVMSSHYFLCYDEKSISKELTVKSKAIVLAIKSNPFGAVRLGWKDKAIYPQNNVNLSSSEERSKEFIWVSEYSPDCECFESVENEEVVAISNVSSEVLPTINHSKFDSAWFDEYNGIKYK